jgi:hypothetical protein
MLPYLDLAKTISKNDVIGESSHVIIIFFRHHLHHGTHLPFLETYVKKQTLKVTR